MRKLFTSGFFKFLLGFSLIILFAFIVLLFLEGQDQASLDGQAAVWYALS